MRSPRWLRPHTIKVINVLPEKDMQEQRSEAILERVKVELVRSSSLGNTGRSNQDGVSVVIDANDIKASKEYSEPQNFRNPMRQFTLRAGDRLEYQGQEYEITGVTHTNPLRNEPELIEVQAE